MRNVSIITCNKSVKNMESAKKLPKIRAISNILHYAYCDSFIAHIFLYNLFIAFKVDQFIE